MNKKFKSCDLVKEGDPFTVGRLPGNDLQVADIRLSSKHCNITKVEKEPGLFSIVLQDTSTNGTFVGGEKVGKGNSVELTNGAEIFLLREQQEVEASEEIGFVFILKCDLGQASQQQKRKLSETEEEKEDKKKKEEEELQKMKKMDEMGEHLEC